MFHRTVWYYFSFFPVTLYSGHVFTNPFYFRWDPVTGVLHLDAEKDPYVINQVPNPEYDEDDIKR